MRQCGISTVKQGERIIGDSEATPNAYPWAVFIASFKNLEDFEYCGGTLISPLTVITAAHCITRPPGNPGYIDFAVVLGCHDLSVLQSECHQYWVMPEDTQFHPNWEYDGNMVYNGTMADIALIHLPEDVSHLYPDGKVYPACLPSKVLMTNNTVEVVGWGLTDGTNNPHVLRAAFMRIQDSSEYVMSIMMIWCSLHLQDTVCADAIDGRWCSGDSGGFVGSSHEGHYEVDGIVSFAAGNCGSNSGMMSTHYYNDWIHEDVRGTVY